MAFLLTDIPHCDIIITIKNMDPEEHTMKIIAIGAVTAGGKTTVVNAINDRLPRTTSLHFDDYSFDGEPDDFTKWVSKAEEFYNVWDLSPLTMRFSTKDCIIRNKTITKPIRQHSIDFRYIPALKKKDQPTRTKQHKMLLSNS